VGAGLGAGLGAGVGMGVGLGALTRKIAIETPSPRTSPLFFATRTEGRSESSVRVARPSDSESRHVTRNGRPSIRETCPSESSDRLSLMSIRVAHPSESFVHPAQGAPHLASKEQRHGRHCGWQPLLHFRGGEG
jgi:hypothetical protein